MFNTPNNFINHALFVAPAIVTTLLSVMGGGKTVPAVYILLLAFPLLPVCLPLFSIFKLFEAVSFRFRSIANFFVSVAIRLHSVGKLFVSVPNFFVSVAIWFHSVGKRLVQMGKLFVSVSNFFVSATKLFVLPANFFPSVVNFFVSVSKLFPSVINHKSSVLIRNDSYPNILPLSQYSLLSTQYYFMFNPKNSDVC